MSNLDKEYESSFTGEEKTEHQLIKVKSNLKIFKQNVAIENILTSSFKKISREKTYMGLNGLIGKWGIVNPVHILKLEDEDEYMLLDGLRRVVATMRNGNKEVEAIVWDFDDKDEGKELANIISLMINRSQTYAVSEQWNMLKTLESVNNLNPGVIEFLLQLNPGDSMKLKDVMLADSEYADIQADLMGGELNIDGAYRKLCTARKKEDRLAKEDNIDLDEDNRIEENKENRRLSLDEVKDLLELETGDLSLEELNKTNEIRGNMVQSTDERHPVDPVIKQNTYIRDDFKCKCCGKDGRGGWIGVLVYHHIVPVFLGGPDTVENGLTLCANCHLNLHLYIVGKLEVDSASLDIDEREIFKNIFKYGNIAITAAKLKSVSKEEFKKKDAGSRRHMYPGENLKDAKQALELSNSR